MADPKVIKLEWGSFRKLISEGRVETRLFITGLGVTPIVIELPGGMVIPIIREILDEVDRDAQEAATRNKD